MIQGVFTEQKQINADFENLKKMELDGINTPNKEINNQ